MKLWKRELDAEFKYLSDLVDVELFGNCEPLFVGPKAVLESVEDECNSCIEDNDIVTEGYVFQLLGLSGGRDDWGWSKDKGFHQLTTRELHPEGCPCCGRPWEDEPT